MDVTLLIVPHCPNENAAAARLRTALDDVGLGHVEFARIVIETEAAAQRWRFVGSPTVLINGVDPCAEVGPPPALACRVYPGPNGPSGLPDPTVLRRALKRAAAQSAMS